MIQIIKNNTAALHSRQSLKDNAARFGSAEKTNCQKIKRNPRFILTAPVTLPAVVVTVAGYLTVAAGVLTAVSQVTVDEHKIKGKGGSNE